MKIPNLRLPRSRPPGFVGYAGARAGRGAIPPVAERCALHSIKDLVAHAPTVEDLQPKFLSYGDSHVYKPPVVQQRFERETRIDGSPLGGLQRGNGVRHRLVV